ncbi:MAG: hypothetical protein DMG59_01810 [Acidobacteria bacterium]|nr:MAG: hypothetical protein DMG59_01810 [Acidobacteriota bacterium]
MSGKEAAMNSRRFVFVCAMLVIPQVLSAQIAGSGSIQGTVSDQTGAIVPGATVTATNVGTGIKTTRQTTAAGLYVLSPLPAGEYSVTVAAAGFQTFVQEHVVVDALSAVGLNVSLKLGAAADQVTVTDAPPILNTQDASLGNTMRNDVYTNLPLAMGVGGIGAGPRNPGGFIYLMPGVTDANRWGQINGGQSFSKEVYVEGVAMTDTVQQGEGRYMGLGISIEAVNQFQIETSGQSVEFNGQGSENYVLKSGTNQFHGSAFEYFRNTVLDARGFFDKVRAAEHQNEFGASVGGPILKNRAFFFGAYDGYRYRTQTATTITSIPTLKERAGNFSELPASQVVYDPQSTSTVGSVTSRMPFEGNVIPASQISAISNYFQAPLPAPTNGNLQNNYIGNLPIGYNVYNYLGKVDVNLTSSHRFYLVGSHGKRSQSGPYREGPTNAPMPLPYSETRIVEEIPTVARASENWSITPSLLNQASFGVSRLAVPITNATIDGKWPIKAGLKGLPSGEADSAFPETSFAGPNSPVQWRGTNARAFQDVENDYVLQENLQWVHGKHSMKFGFQHQRLEVNEKSRSYGSLFLASFSNNQTAGFSPTGTLLTTTGNSYASFLLGALNTPTITEDWVVENGGRFRNYAWWASDDFKVSPRFTLNLGLRYDIMKPYVEVKDRFSFLNPALANPAAGGRPGALMFGDNFLSGYSCNCSTPVNTQFGTLGPRIGAAWSLNDRTVIRAAYGIMYSRRGAVGGRGGARTGTDLLGFSANPGFANSNGFSPAFYWDTGVPAYQKPPVFDATLNTGNTLDRPTAGSITYGDPNSKPPRYQNWNFSVQRALSNSMTLTVAYTGNNGKYEDGGGRGIWTNQMDPRNLALGSLLTAQATPANIAAAQAIIPSVALPFPNFRGTISQMLRPFPQYSGVTDVFGNIGQSNYNALQVTFARRMAAGLTFNANYTFSKNLSDTNGGRSAYYWKDAKSLTSYELPFGNGKAVPVSNSAVARALVSGWRISAITRVFSGFPLASIGASCNLPNAGSCQASFNPAFSGDVRINGDWGSGDLLGANPPAFLDKNAFVNPAPYTYGNTPITDAFGLRAPYAFNQDLSLKREFRIHERMRFLLQWDAFNAFNQVRFAAPSINTTSAGFGKITSQTNTPRLMQIVTRLEF